MISMNDYNTLDLLEVCHNDTKRITNDKILWEQY